jgi:hydrogenase expression/formation protein HypE
MNDSTPSRPAASTEAATSDPHDGRVLLAHGGGGELTRELLERRVLPRLKNPLLEPLGDSAVLDAPAGRLAFTTDSFVVQPLRFPGGDIGRLAVCGTVNDLAMMGARPLALSLAMVLEEGLELAELDAVADSIASAAAEADVPVATGDTKVIERGGCGGMILTTAGVGAIPPGREFSPAAVRPGDAVLVNGPLAEHGLAVMSVREDLGVKTRIRSDAAPLNGLVQALLDSGAAVRFLRDPTRGGLAMLAADLAEESGLTVELDEQALPLTASVRHLCELLGLDALSVANEGKVVAVVAAEDVGRALAAMREHPLGRDATEIGRLVDRRPPLCELLTRSGGRRVVRRPYGEDLPRIC